MQESIMCSHMIDRIPVLSNLSRPTDPTVPTAITLAGSFVIARQERQILHNLLFTLEA